MMDFAVMRTSLWHGVSGAVNLFVYNDVDFLALDWLLIAPQHWGLAPFSIPQFNPDPSHYYLLLILQKVEKS
jgi:hypothetical protein